MKFAARRGSLTLFDPPPTGDPLWRDLKAYAVEEIEPGRIDELERGLS